MRSKLSLSVLISLIPLINVNASELTIKDDQFLTGTNVYDKVIVQGDTKRIEAGTFRTENAGNLPIGYEGETTFWEDIDYVPEVNEDSDIRTGEQFVAYVNKYPNSNKKSDWVTNDGKIKYGIQSGPTIGSVIAGALMLGWIDSNDLGIDGFNSGSINFQDGSNTKINGELYLGKSTANIDADVIYVTDTKSWSDADLILFEVVSTTANTSATIYANAVNNGGLVDIETLTFSNKNNQYLQNSGTTTLRDYAGGGQIIQHDGTLNLVTLDSDATITSTGGVVDANTIALTKKTFTAKDTQLKTGLDQVADFQQIIAKAQGLLMASHDSEASLNASILGRTEEVNSILSQFKNNVSWSGGSFYFKGSYTKSVADSAVKLIQQTYGTNVGVEFESVVDDPTPANVVNGFTAAVTNAIINENAQTEGVIFHQYAFDARNNDLVVGREDGVTSSVGFKNLNGSHGALVTGGKALVLLGEDDATNIASGQLSAKESWRSYQQC